MNTENNANHKAELHSTLLAAWAQRRINAATYDIRISELQRDIIHTALALYMYSEPLGSELANLDEIHQLVNLFDNQECPLETHGINDFTE